MQFEMLLNVYLTWQLLLKQLIRLLWHLILPLHFCSGCRVKGEAGSARGAWQLLNTRFRCRIRCVGRFHRQIRWDRGVGQGGAERRSCRKCNNWGGRAEKANGKVTSSFHWYCLRIMHAIQILQWKQCPWFYLRAALVHLYSPHFLKVTNSEASSKCRGDKRIVCAETRIMLTVSINGHLIAFNCNCWSRYLSIH